MFSLLPIYSLQPLTCDLNRKLDKVVVGIDEDSEKGRFACENKSRARYPRGLREIRVSGLSSFSLIVVFLSLFSLFLTFLSLCFLETRERFL